MIAPIDKATRTGRAAEMLALACVLWGASFTWVKAALAGMAAARGGGAGDFLWVPVLYIGWRFILGAALWGIVFRRSLKGWTPRTARRSILLGVLLVAPMIAQQIGLDRTSESVSAFLTSLTIVFTPLTLWLLFRERRGGEEEVLRARALVDRAARLSRRRAPPQEERPRERARRYAKKRERVEDVGREAEQPDRDEREGVDDGQREGEPPPPRPDGREPEPRRHPREKRASPPGTHAPVPAPAPRVLYRTGAPGSSAACPSDA